MNDSEIDFFANAIMSFKLFKKLKIQMAPNFQTF